MMSGTDKASGFLILSVYLAGQPSGRLSACTQMQCMWHDCCLCTLVLHGMEWQGKIFRDKHDKMHSAVAYDPWFSMRTRKRPDPIFWWVSGCVLEYAHVRGA
jgi:hypothetical protein